MRKLILFLFFITILTGTFLFISFVHPSFSAEKISTKIIVRVVSWDAKVIGSSVGGALVQIKNLETGEILAEGKQEGGTGDTDQIMIQSHKRGEPLYGTPGTAFYQAQLFLDKPTQVEISANAPLAYPHAIQKGSMTLTLIPGKDILGEGVIIPLRGLIVNIGSPSSNIPLKKGEEVDVKVEIKML